MLSVTPFIGKAFGQELQEEAKQEKMQEKAPQATAELSLEERQKALDEKKAKAESMAAIIAE